MSNIDIRTLDDSQEQPLPKKTPDLEDARSETGAQVEEVFEMT